MSGYVANDRGKRIVPPVEPYNGDFDKQPVRPTEFPEKSVSPIEPVKPLGCVFAKSCNLPVGVISHDHSSGFIPVERLHDYGDWAVLATNGAMAVGGTSLGLVGGSTTGSALTARLGGQLSLGLLEVSGTMALGTLLGAIAMLIPNNTSADSAFYTSEQYALLSMASTRVRVSVKYLPDGSISAYGFYTGTRTDWQKVSVIEAIPRGDQFVADLGQGIELIWTPAADTSELGIPALEGAPSLPPVWVYPPTEQAEQALVNPQHPPDYQDAIIWFPNTGIQPIYISLSVPGDHSYYPAPKGLAAFPEAQVTPRKTPVKGGGGLRKRWKTRDGTILEWDSQHGTVEKYNRRGEHLGEFDPETGEQTKGVDKTRKVKP